MAENESIGVCRYLCADLPQQELEDMEVRMEEDVALQEELDFYRGLKEAIADEDMMQYRRQIRRVFERKKRWPRSPSAPAKVKRLLSDIKGEICFKQILPCGMQNLEKAVEGFRRFV